MGLHSLRYGFRQLATIAAMPSPAPAPVTPPPPAPPPSPPVSTLPPEVPAPAKPTGRRLTVRIRAAEAPGVPHALEHLADRESVHVDERCGGRVADDVADHFRAVGRAGADSRHACRCFMLGIPSGALADILDRRRYFLFTQLWVAVVALLLCARGAVRPDVPAAAAGD